MAGLIASAAFGRGRSLRWSARPSARPPPWENPPTIDSPRASPSAARLLVEEVVELGQRGRA